jgi:hypothetical protein
MKDCLMEERSKIRKIAFVGDHLPRKCRIATFTSDLLTALKSGHRRSRPVAPEQRSLFGRN